MEYSKKYKKDSTYIYLKEYLSRNSNLLENNYQIKEYISDNLGLGSYKTFSIKEIYDYVYPKVVEKKQTSTVPKEQYDYNFLEPNSNNPREILSKYFKLGMTSDNEEAKKELLKRKITYYQSLNIPKIKIGINSFNGYLGLCLEDGTVILDKFYEDLEKGKIADEQAIYITDEEEFETITKLSKSECIGEIKRGKIKAKRIYHQGAWEERMNHLNLK